MIFHLFLPFGLVLDIIIVIVIISALGIFLYKKYIKKEEISFPSWSSITNIFSRK